jgi:hypothetical protein
MTTDAGCAPNVRAALDSTRYPLVLDLPHSEESGAMSWPRWRQRPLRAARAGCGAVSWQQYVVANAAAPRCGSSSAIPILGSDAVSSWGRSGADSLPWGGVQFVDFVDIRLFARAAGVRRALRGAHRSAGHRAGRAHV